MSATETEAHTYVILGPPKTTRGTPPTSLGKHMQATNYEAPGGLTLS